MSDAQAAGRVGLLEAWLAEVERAGSGSSHSGSALASPPAGLTPQDFAAAGFEFYAEGAGRRGNHARFQVNFSPDRRHQSVLLQGPGRGAGALLWIDGRAVPVPVDADGAPKSETLMRWLDRRFSQGALAEVTGGPLGEPDPAKAVSLWAWASEVGRLVQQGPHSYTLAYPAPPTNFTPRECEAAGFGFYNERSAHSLLDDNGASAVRIDFSPDLSHQAVSVRGPDDWSGALLWVDSEAVPVPRSEDGDPLCEQLAQWPDDRFVYAETGGLWNHPLLDPNKVDPLGEIRGLLIWDTVKHVQHVELPEANQAWTAPILVAREDSWRIYPNGAAFKQDRPDRVVPIPR